MTRVGGPLDRYVLMEWTKIFLATALGLPVLLVIIDLTDHLQSYLDRSIPRGDIAMSYLYWLPQSMFLAMPAAVLFATVFAIGNFTRHSEITAAKASGISFYRMVAPLLLGAILAAGLDVLVAEVTPLSDARRNALLQVDRAANGSQRINFAYAADYGRVYKAQMLDVALGTLDRVQIERKGNGADYPTVIVSAISGRHDPKSGYWRLDQGEMHIIRDSAPEVDVSFDALVDRRMTEKPADLMAKPRETSEMRLSELNRFIHSLERSGGDANPLRIDRALRFAIPLTCFVIALFGAPLATSTQRGGTAYGVGLSLLTAISFLLLTQLTKAVGNKGIISPDLIAFVPNALFFLVALVLLARTRT